MNSLASISVLSLACLVGCVAPSARPGSDEPTTDTPDSSVDETGLIRSALRVMELDFFGDVQAEWVTLSSTANLCDSMQQFEDDVASHYSQQPEANITDDASAEAYCEAQIAWVEELAAIYRPSYRPGAWGAAFTFQDEQGSTFDPGEYSFDGSSEFSVLGGATINLEDPYAPFRSMEFDCEEWATTRGALPTGPEWSSIVESVDRSTFVDGLATLEDTAEGLRLTVDAALESQDGEPEGDFSADEVLEDCTFRPVSAWQ